MLGRIVAAIGIVALALIGGSGVAKADPPMGRGRGRGRGGYHNPYRGPSNPWGGFWGGVLGGWLGSQLAPKGPPEDAPDELEPYSKEWYAYCTGKYRSFDPQTGTYLSYEGIRRPCR